LIAQKEDSFVVALSFGAGSVMEMKGITDISL
jgi:hypothetical protein